MPIPTTTTDTPPSGYLPHDRPSPLTAPWAPIFARTTAQALQLAVQVREAHCNSRGFAHGGLIAALADNAMGLSAVRLARAAEAGTTKSAVTVGLTLDFISSATIGEWLEFHPTVLKVGGTLAFVECHVRSSERLVARASASFRLG